MAELMLMSSFCPRVFLAQARIFLAKVVWHFDLELVENQGDWLNQRAWLVFEPKPLFVRLKERSVPSQT